MGIGSRGFPGRAVEEDSGGASSEEAGSGVGCTRGVDDPLEETSRGCSGMDDEMVAGSSGLGTVIGAPDSFDGPVGSGMDSAASRPGDSATGLGMTCTGPGAAASSLRDSVDDLEGVPGLKPPVRAVDDRLIIVPMRDRMDFPGDDP
ncbi:hypothetical protein BJV74DRAFT_317775 [Russula compacta]|nr:hypothetical protein BJV74DRAFT_317775 [Russula compacta]